MDDKEFLGARAAHDLASAPFPLPRLLSGENVLAALPLSGTVAVVGDARTLAAAPVSLAGEIRIALPGHPKADDVTATHIMREAAKADFILAVGSGTINDLCKYAAYKLNLPYGVIATAASMNGYASANASITLGGYKTTFPARLPQLIVCDWNVLCAAPARLTRSGLADVLARPSAQFDWLLAHHWLGTPYDARPFAWLLPFEQALLAQAGAVGRGEADAIRLLMQSIILSGLGMSFCGGSYPASQSEHMIAHLMDMAFAEQLPQTFHGEQIGVTTLATLRRQEALLSGPPPEPLGPADDAVRDELSTLLGLATAHEALQAFAHKHRLVQQAAVPDWAALAPLLAAVHLPPEVLEGALTSAGCPTTPLHLGWPLGSTMQANRLARYTRERFTCLDIA